VIQHVALKVKPAQAVTLGALFFDYQTVSTHGLPNLNGRELDLYADAGPVQTRAGPAQRWQPSGGNGTNVYSQLTVAVPF